MAAARAYKISYEGAPRPGGVGRSETMPATPTDGGAEAFKPLARRGQERDALHVVGLRERVEGP
ncbi:hypothetical protein GCM10009682_45700 [Luedemannella flava]|uniref:Uncharacterized protein n=1 Tax=Luedemannella flava TaxID=349316 RepID=A0ABP4YNF7_9ACTN